MRVTRLATKAPCSAKLIGSCWYFARLEAHGRLRASDRVEPAGNRAGIHRACVACGFLATAKDNHRRNAAYVKTRRGRRLVLGIELRKSKSGFQRRRARLVI